MKHTILIFAVIYIAASCFAADVRYRIVPIYPPAGIEAYGIAAHGLNDQGAVVGTYGYFLDPTNQSAGQIGRAFKFFIATDGPLLLKALGSPDGTNSVEIDFPVNWVTEAVGINSTGQIAVYASRVQPVVFEAFRYTPGVGYEPLGGFGGEQTETEAINEAGQVTGFSEGPDGKSYAFRYTDGLGMENIGTNFTMTSRGFAINDLGWVAGYGDGYAFLYRDDLGVINLGRGRAYGINDRGSVVGISWVSPNDRGFVYRNGQLTVVGPESNNSLLWTILRDINNYDIAVGSDVREDQGMAAIIWNEREGVVRLNSLIPPDSGWWLTSASAINDHGQIVGQGNFNGQTLAYRLDPIPPKLEVNMEGTNAVVSWYPDWPGVVLETAADPASTNWQAVATDETNVIVLPRTAPAQYFRLTRPPPPEISPGGEGR